MKGAKIVKAIVGVAVVAAAIGAVVYICATQFRAQTVERQMERKYGLEVDYKTGVRVEDDEFSFKTKDGVNVWGTCDRFGNVKTDTYVNYYYADECVEHIQYQIGGFFSDSVIIYDGLKLSELSSIPLEAGNINSFDDYIKATQNAYNTAEYHKYYYKISVRVYVRESEAVQNICDAAIKLLESDEYFNVVFYRVPDNIFDLHKEAGIYAYYKGEALDRLTNNPNEAERVEIHDLIYKQKGLAFDGVDLVEDTSNYDEKQPSKGTMLVISATIEGPIDYYNDDRVLGYSYTIDWNGTITRKNVYQQSGEVENGYFVLSPEDFKAFREFAQDAYETDRYKTYRETDVMDGCTYSFTYYPDGSSKGVFLFGGYCYSNDELYGAVKRAAEYFK